MAGRDSGTGLLGLPDVAHDTIAGFCAQWGLLMLMSTSSAGREAFAAYTTAITTVMQAYDGDERPQRAFCGLMRRLPNLGHLRMWLGRRTILDHRNRAEGILYTAVAGGWGGRLRELSLPVEAPQDASAMGAAIATGNLPSLQRLSLGFQCPEQLRELTKALRGAASPRLTALECCGHHADMVAFVETLEARMALGCCPITHLSINVDPDDEFLTAPPAVLLRAFTSRSMAKLKTLRLRGFLHDEEVGAVSEALRQLKPQELTEIKLQGWTDEDFITAGHFFDCLTPTIVPSLHTVSLGRFDINPAECIEQLTAALREGALMHVKELELYIDAERPSYERLMSALAGAHGCPNLHKLELLVQSAVGPRGLRLAEGAFPSLRVLSIQRLYQCADDFYLEELLASLEKGAPCWATLERVELGITPPDLVHVPCLARLLAGLLRLEYVDIGETFGRDRANWGVSGGREAVLELMSLFVGLDEKGDQEALRSSILRILPGVHIRR